MSQLAMMLRNPALDCVPGRSIWDDKTLPPSFVTAAVTRCSSAAPAIVTVAPSRNGEPAGPPSPGPRLPAAAALRPSNCSNIAQGRDFGTTVKDVGKRASGHEQQQDHHAKV